MRPADPKEFFRSAQEVLIMRRILPTRLLVVLFFGVSCAAQELPAPRVVDLKVGDGTTLKATYFAAAKPGPGVLLLHQCNQQRKNWDELAARLAGTGINVLTLDYRGYGESGGTPYKDLPQDEVAKIVAEKWPGDVDTAFNYLVSQPGVTRGIVGAGGASCGVNQSIQLARRHPEVKSLVLLSGNTDRGGREFLRKSEKLPMMLSAADDDGAAVEVMQWLYGLSTNPGSKFVHYTSGGHGTEMFAAHKELPGTIVEWYVQTLVKTPGSAPTVSGALGKTRAPGILEEIDSAGGASTAERKLAEARRHDPKANLFSEAMVNLLGYEHLQSGDNKGAVEILKLNAVAYPNSPNVYDSLSDAYLADGQKDLARENAKKALELLKSDTTDPEAQRKAIQESAETKLKQLGAGPE
jgi:dienelactone hydrolase